MRIIGIPARYRILSLSLACTDALAYFQDIDLFHVLLCNWMQPLVSGIKKLFACFDNSSMLAPMGSTIRLCYE